MIASTTPIIERGANVRPKSRHVLASLTFILPPALAGTSLVARWRATSRSTRGDLEGDVEIPVMSGDDVPWASDLTIDPPTE
ncbi:MAG: hypothetical protein WD844_07960 [Thermoleophilaceae bacterium]